MLFTFFHKALHCFLVTIRPPTESHETIELLKSFAIEILFVFQLVGGVDRMQQVLSIAKRPHIVVSMIDSGSTTQSQPKTILPSVP